MDKNYDITLEEIAATVAHEIKNPLSLIKANLELLELEHTDISKKNLDIIYNELDKINKLTKELINIMKPYSYNFVSCSLNDLVMDIYGTFSGVCDDRGIIMETHLEHNLYILCDLLKLNQVITNIMKNAVEAVENVEKKKIVISTFRADNYACMTIADSGIGIGEKYMDEIGRPFFTTKVNGTGLGLPYAKKVIEEHNGIMTVSGINNGGTTVSIMLPLKTEENKKN